MAWTDPRTGATTTDPRGPDWQYPASGPELPPPPPPPPPPPNRWAPWVAFATALLVAGAVGFAVTSAWTNDDTQPFTRPPTPELPFTVPPNTNPSIGPVPSIPMFPILPPTTAPPVTTPSTPPAPDPDATALERIVVHQPDVPSQYPVDLIPGGDETGEQVTLDLCDGVFPSETLRTARRQVAAEDDISTRRFSTEAVLYKTPANARQALRELEQARADCPTYPRLTPSGELNIVTFGAAPDGSWPAVGEVTRQAYDYTRSDLFLDEEHNVAVYLVRGRALLALYFNDVDSALIPVQGQTTVAGITNLFEKRLAALPASVVNAP